MALGEGQTPTAFGGHLYYVFAAGAPVVLVLLAIWYFAARAPAARTIPVDDWLMGATAVFVGLYYVKYIGRTDHVYQPFEMVLPVLFYAIYRVVSAAEAWLASRPPSRLPRHTVSLPLLVVLLLRRTSRPSMPGRSRPGACRRTSGSPAPSTTRALPRASG